MTDDLLLKLRKVLAFDESSVATSAGYYSVDTPEFHEIECPLLFRFATCVARDEHARRAKVDEALMSLVEACIEANYYSDKSSTGKALERLRAAVEG